MGPENRVRGDLAYSMDETQGYPVIVRCEDLAVWLLARTANFPRSSQRAQAPVT